MSYTILQWMGPELARAGLVRNEPWVEEHCWRASAMFEECGQQIPATLIAAIHPHGLQYLEQAPVLAAAVGRESGLKTIRQRQDAARALLPMLAKGSRLRDVLSAYDIALPLRAVQFHRFPRASSTLWRICQDISEFVDNSVISQAIPPDPTAQYLWLSNLNVLWGHLLRRRAPDYEILKWAVAAIGRHYAGGAGTGAWTALSEIGDYLLADREAFNPRWTFARVAIESAEWHADLRLDSLLSGGDADVEINYGPMPVRCMIDGYEFVALRSFRDLIIEGAAMHHCVATYHANVKAGICWIYSIRKDGQRVATAEFGLRLASNALPSDMPIGIPFSIASKGAAITPAQIKGPCNAAVAKAVRTACSSFAVERNSELRVFVQQGRKCGKTAGMVILDEIGA